MKLRRYFYLSILALTINGPANAAGVSPIGVNPQLAMQQNWMSFQWMNMMAQHFMSVPMDEATRFGILDAMLRAMDTNMMLGMQEGANASVEQMPALKIPMFPSQSEHNFEPNTVTGVLSNEAKRNLYQAMMMMSPLSMRDMISIMADKMEVAEDVSFDDAVEAMRLRANEVNFKFVGHSPLYKDIEAITGEPTTRVEIFHFCDAMVARRILDYAPEFVIYLPCRVALLEDAKGKLWVMTLDWNVNWLNFSQNPNSVLDKKLREEAERIRDALHYIMEGAATGDF